MNAPISKSNYQVTFHFINADSYTDRRIYWVQAPDMIQAITVANNIFTDQLVSRFRTTKIEVE